MKYVKPEVSEILSQLRIGQRITICYRCSYSKEYRIHTGRVTQINNYWKHLTMDKATFDFCEIDIITIP